MRIQGYREKYNSDENICIARFHEAVNLFHILCHIIIVIIVIILSFTSNLYAL